MINKLFSLVIFAVASACLTVPAHAALLLSNLTSPYDGDFGGTPDSADDFMTGNVALNISSVDIFWGLGSGGTSNRVGFFTDSGGLPSGTQVGGWFTNPTSIASNTTISYSGNVSLSANTNYWMVVDILDGSQVGFSDNQTVFSDPSTLGATIIGPRPGSAFGDAQLASWTNDQANLLYALSGTAVPLPAAVWLFGSGLLGLAGISRRKK